MDLCLICLVELGVGWIEVGLLERWELVCIGFGCGVGLIEAGIVWCLYILI